MAQLQVILDRLIAENLHGSLTKSTPVSAATISYPPLATRTLRRTNSHGDLHAPFQREEEDPRWPNLFEEFFLENNDNTNDDLLFFVRQPHPENEDLDPVFVKRKSPQSHVMPSLDDTVLWKETFFLNLIVQLPCKLTVAVCTRTTTEAEGDGTTPKTSMRCSSKYVSKRVYALPTKSRMDVKEASMECSYPLIYYVIDDYEEMFEHLNVSKDEYLCVELAVTIPRKSDVEEETDSDDEKYYISHKTRKNRRSMTDGPFPQPCSDNKITLFQGAAPYSSLLEIYKQKAANKLNPRFKMGPIIPPTEYVMMRGPAGKGHAQVAITALSTEENIDELSNVSEAPLSSLSSTAASIFGNINNMRMNSNSNSREKIPNNSQTPPSPRSSSSSSFFQSLKRLSQLSMTDRGPSDPESLKCCMTFVHVPWTNIISDLLDFAKKNTT